MGSGVPPEKNQWGGGRWVKSVSVFPSGNPSSLMNNGVCSEAKRQPATAGAEPVEGVALFITT